MASVADRELPRGVGNVRGSHALIAGVAGLALAAPWGIEYDLNYVKIGVKLVVLLVIGALLGIGSARQKRGEAVPSAVFWLIGILALANAGMAVIWR